MENNFTLNEAIDDHNEQERRVLCLVRKEGLLYLLSCHLLEEKNTERLKNSELFLGL